MVAKDNKQKIVTGNRPSREGNSPTDSNSGTDTQSGEYSDPQFAALAANVAQLIPVHEQANTGHRRQLPDPQCAPEYKQGKRKANTNHGTPINVTILSSVGLLRPIKLPRFIGAGGVSWDAFISVLKVGRRAINVMKPINSNCWKVA